MDVADCRRLIAPGVSIGASHDFEIGQSVMRLLVAAGFAETRGQRGSAPASALLHAVR
jgi:hypothetical protein